MKSHSKINQKKVEKIVQNYNVFSAKTEKESWLK
jgi:hypothetical protein